ncbi:MAG: hypothetical protein IT425_13185 [Pirellulales bacterium]|nr:hypothetical protein [Pirellulales bacterium]
MGHGSILFESAVVVGRLYAALFYLVGKKTRALAAWLKYSTFWRQPPDTMIILTSHRKQQVGSL